MDDSILQVIEERCRKATAGPWKSFIEGRDFSSGSSFIQTGGEDIELTGATEADQDFIAACRQDIPLMLEEIRRLRKIVEERKPESVPVRTERVELTVLCLIQDGDRVLLQNRVKNDWKGYTLPGGHVEPGESFVDAVVREMREETGLTVTDPKLVGVKQFPIEGGRYLVLLFKAEHFTGEVVSSDEGKMEWIPYSMLSEVSAVDDLSDLLKVINDPSLNEFQYVVEGEVWTALLK